MSYKSILVHVDRSDEGRARTRVAAAVAAKFGARLIGLGARAFDPMLDPVGLSVTKLKEIVDEELAAAERMFREEAHALGKAAEWRFEVDYPTAAMLRHAVAADLVVAGRGVGAMPPERQAACADLIMGVGGPVLAAPQGASLGWRRALICWKNTRETRRAVADALPLLKLTEAVHVIRFAADGEEPVPDAAQEDVVARLKLHGVPAQGEVRQRATNSVAEDIMAAAAKAKADFIVAGGYGHSRLREWALGGVTQGLLQKSQHCVLFSH